MWTLFVCEKFYCFRFFVFVFCFLDPACFIWLSGRLHVVLWHRLTTLCLMPRRVCGFYLIRCVSLGWLKTHSSLILKNLIYLFFSPVSLFVCFYLFIYLTVQRRVWYVSTCWCWRIPKCYSCRILSDLALMCSILCVNLHLAFSGVQVCFRDVKGWYMKLVWWYFPVYLADQFKNLTIFNFLIV